MKAPELTEIYAAELKFAQAAQDTVNGVERARAAVRRAREAMRERLAKPSTLALVAGAAALSGFLLSRRSKPRVRISGRRRVEKEPTASGTSVMLALILRQAMARLPGILEQIWMRRRQKMAASAGTATSTPASPPPPKPIARPPGKVLH